MERNQSLPYTRTPEMKNLLFSLPDRLVSEVYSYDTTHRIFGDTSFKTELKQGYMRVLLTTFFVEIVTEHMENIIFEDSMWSNEYGYIDSNQSYGYDKERYSYREDFFVVTHQIDDVVYFKILPEGATKENCSFLRTNPNPKSKFDGYFISSESSELDDRYWNKIYKIRDEFSSTDFYMFRNRVYN